MGKGKLYNDMILLALVERHVPASDEDWFLLSRDYQNFAGEDELRSIKSLKRHFFEKICIFGKPPPDDGSERSLFVARAQRALERYREREKSPYEIHLAPDDNGNAALGDSDNDNDDDEDGDDDSNEIINFSKETAADASSFISAAAEGKAILTGKKRKSSAVSSSFPPHLGIITGAGSDLINDKNKRIVMNRPTFPQPMRNSSSGVNNIAAAIDRLADTLIQKESDEALRSSLQVSANMMQMFMLVNMMNTISDQASSNSTTRRP